MARRFWLKQSTITILVLTCLFSLNTHSEPSTIRMKILGINDFHGQISAGRFIKNEPVGGAVILASYLKHAQAGMEDNTLITIMGDQVGASPPASGLLNDEPSILFINSLGNTHCSPEDRMNPLCNIVATVGNHEFDKGQQTMHELMYGRNTPPTDSWIPLTRYPGASYPFISANIVDSKTDKPVFPPYIIKLVHNIPIAFIGAVTKNAAGSIFPGNADGITFTDEATAINKYIPEVKAKGARIIIILIHEGGSQSPYEGKTQKETQIQGDIKQIVYELDDVDVVMAGHTHQFLNGYLPNHLGKDILVTEANSYSASFAEVTLEVDKQTHQVTHKSAQIITTYANRWPGTVPDEPTRQLIGLAESKVAPIINGYVGTLEASLFRNQNEDGESNLGNFIADAFKNVMETDIGLTNTHGLRDDMHQGSINWGDVYTVLPFSNKIVVVSLTGAEIHELLEQQWTTQDTNMLQISGLTYTYDPNQILGHKVVAVFHQNVPLLKDQRYTIATTDFIASGGGIFSVMKNATMLKAGEVDRDTVMQYIKQLPQPFSASIEGRIKKVVYN